jgi:hypothetical protein
VGSIKAFYGDGSPLGAEGRRPAKSTHSTELSVISSFGDRDKSLAAIKKAVESCIPGVLQEAL